MAVPVDDPAKVRTPPGLTRARRAAQAVPDLPDRVPEGIAPVHHPPSAVS